MCTTAAPGRVVGRHANCFAAGGGVLIAATASAHEPLKIGMVLEMSGAFADFGMQMMNGARAYMKVHGDTVAGRKVELIVKDMTGVPDVARRVAQEPGRRPFDADAISGDRQCDYSNH